MARKESHFRSILKGITWRILGTLDTLLISWLVLNETDTASGIAIWDTAVKFGLYYGHERLWQNIPLGLIRQYHIFRGWAKKVIPRDYHNAVVRKESHVRSILKGISWRIIGTITTIIVAYWLTGDTSSAFAIGGIEVFTKFALYYLHERLWQLAPRGTVRKIIDKDE